MIVSWFFENVKFDGGGGVLDGLSLLRSLKNSKEKVKKFKTFRDNEATHRPPTNIGLKTNEISVSRSDKR